MVEKNVGRQKTKSKLDILVSLALHSDPRSKVRINGSFFEPFDFYTIMNGLLYKLDKYFMDDPEFKNFKKSVKGGEATIAAEKILPELNLRRFPRLERFINAAGPQSLAPMTQKRAEENSDDSEGDEVEAKNEEKEEVEEDEVEAKDEEKEEVKEKDKAEAKEDAKEDCVEASEEDKRENSEAVEEDKEVQQETPESIKKKKLDQLNAKKKQTRLKEREGCTEFDGIWLSGTPKRSKRVTKALRKSEISYSTKLETCSFCYLVVDRTHKIECAKNHAKKLQPIDMVLLGVNQGKILYVGEVIASGAFGIVKQGRIYQGEGNYINVAIKFFVPKDICIQLLKETAGQPATKFTASTIANKKSLRRVFMRGINEFNSIYTISQYGKIAPKYYDEFSCPYLFFVMERCECTLDVFFSMSKNIYEKMKAFKQMLKALKTLHENNIYHGDLKSNNVMLTSKKRAVLCDFGRSRICTESPRFPCLTVECYIPPEIDINPSRGKGQKKATDMWACGCMLHELLTGNILFPFESSITSKIKLWLRPTDNDIKFIKEFVSEDKRDEIMKEVKKVTAEHENKEGYLDKIKGKTITLFQNHSDISIITKELILMLLQGLLAIRLGSRLNAEQACRIASACLKSQDEQTKIVKRLRENYGFVFSMEELGLK